MVINVISCESIAPVAFLLDLHDVLALYRTRKKRCFLKTAAAKNLKAIKKIAKGDNYLQHSEKMLQF